MKKIVIATTNKNKVERIKLLLRNEDYEVIGLEEYGFENIDEPEETKDTPVGIAMEKALHYAKYLPEDVYVLTQDDTLEFEGIKNEDSPGLHIKKPVIEKYGQFNDEFASLYYMELAKKYGGTIPLCFNYGHAVAIKKDKEREITKIVGAQSKLKLRLVDKINKLEKSSGYFLSALTQANIDGKWIYSNDLNEEQKIKIDIALYKSIMTLLKNI